MKHWAIIQFEYQRKYNDAIGLNISFVRKHGLYRSISNRLSDFWWNRVER